MGASVRGMRMKGKRRSRMLEMISPAAQPAASPELNMGTPKRIAVVIIPAASMFTRTIARDEGSPTVENPRFTSAAS
jgi:hypothetical protein